MYPDFTSIAKWLSVSTLVCVNGNQDSKDPKSKKELVNSQYYLRLQKGWMWRHSHATETCLIISFDLCHQRIRLISISVKLIGESQKNILNKDRWTLGLRCKCMNRAQRRCKDTEVHKGTEAAHFPLVKTGKHPFAAVDALISLSLSSWVSADKNFLFVGSLLATMSQQHCQVCWSFCSHRLTWRGHP